MSPQHVKAQAVAQCNFGTFRQDTEQVPVRKRFSGVSVSLGKAFESQLGDPSGDGLFTRPGSIVSTCLQLIESSVLQARAHFQWAHTVGCNLRENRCSSLTA